MLSGPVINFGFTEIATIAPEFITIFILTNSVCFFLFRYGDMLRWGARLNRFRDDIHGGITALTLTVFLVMVVSVGMAVDFMRHETYRAELQDAVDRGVLAAAAFNQTVDPETTIRAYLKSTNFVRDGYDLDVPPAVVTTGTKIIKATATYKVNTFFLRMVGIPTLDIVATGSAIEGASKVEVSLVLDISTSMVIYNSGTTGKTRLEVLKSSANQFLDLMFTGNNNDRLSLSLVPFAGQVNVGQDAFNHLVSTRVHSYSNCVDFPSSSFTYIANNEGDTTAAAGNTMVALPTVNTMSQMQHFNFSKYYNSATAAYDLYGPEGISNVDWGWCPTDAQAITYHETNKDVLKHRIDNLRTHEATGTYLGAKWGAMLLDPSSQALANAVYNKNAPALDSNGVVSATTEPAQGLTPGAYDDVEVQKFLIIMSDGATTGQVRLQDSLYDETADYEFWASNLSPNQSNDFVDVDVDGSGITDGPTIDGNYTTDPREASREAARFAFRNVCETSKDNGVVVFAIGFDLDPDPATATQDQVDAAARAKADLQACASSTFFYDVKGSGLLDAFSEIASTIQKLRLLN